MEKVFYSTVVELLAAQLDRLHQLIGQTLISSCTAWDNSTNLWFADEPVILEFSKASLEITFAKLNDLALTWNSIDLQTVPNWWGSYSSDLPLGWRRDKNEILNKM